MRSFLLYIFVTFFTIVSANEVVSVGSVELVKGNVKIKSEGSFKKSKLSLGSEIKSGDLIMTSRKATAVIRLRDGSALALDERSTLHFASLNSAEQKKGRIYYKITSRDAKNSLKIKTPFAIIGIKGTTFIVEAGDSSSVKLKEGLVGIESQKEEFKLYRKTVLQEYNNYISKQQSEFEKFKNKKNEKVALITKEFDLQAGNSISFDGQRVDEKGFSKEDNASFEYFEKLIESIE